jgi:hypothetical protein
MDLSPTMGMNCFGSDSREAGHKREPAPPHTITGTIGAIVIRNILQL